MKTCGRNFGDSSGSILTMVAIALPVIILLLILVLDLNRSQTGSAKLQAATDSSSLGTADWIFRARLDQLQKGNDVDIHTWLPPSDEITGYAQNLLEQNYAKDNPDSEINYGNFNANAKVTKNYTDVEVKGCADVNQSFGNKEGKKVCVDSTARIANPKLVNAEIAIVLPSVRMLEKNSISRSVLEHALFGGPYLSGNKEPLINKWFGGTQDMKSNNSRISFVPYTTHQNLYPYGGSFVKDYPTNDSAYSIENIQKQYPVFNDEDFNEFTNVSSSSAGLKGFKFDSAYDYFRTSKDGNGEHGKVFEEIYPHLGAAFEGKDDLVFIPSGYYYQGYDVWQFPSYSAKYGVGPEVCDSGIVRKHFMDKALNLYIQPLTEDITTMKKFFELYTPIVYNDNPYYLTQQVRQDLPQDLNNRYFAYNTTYFDSWITQSSEAHNGLLWGWQTISEKSSGKWTKPSVFERQSNYVTDRSNLPIKSGNNSNKAIVLFANNMFTNSEWVGNFVREGAQQCDSYVEFHPNLPKSRVYTPLPHVDLDVRRASIFDSIDASYNKSADAATFHKLCDSIKSEGIGIHFIGSGYYYSHPNGKSHYFLPQMQDCTQGEASSINLLLPSVPEVATPFYEILDNIFAKMAARNNINIMLVE